MRKIIFILGCLFLSGCSRLFNTIQLDTLMSQKIETNALDISSNYNGIVSVDTIKDISIKAVNSYLQKSLQLDNVAIAVQFYESETMENLILEWKHKPYLFSFSEEVIDSLNDELSEGIFIVEMKGETYDYQVILTASSGELLEIDDCSKGTRFSDGDKVEVEEVIAMCQNYIEMVMGINPDTLSFEIGSSDFSNNYELTYYDKQTKEQSFLLEVNPYTLRIVRCSLGFWSTLN